MNRASCKSMRESRAPRRGQDFKKSDARLQHKVHASLHKAGSTALRSLHLEPLTSAHFMASSAHHDVGFLLGDALLQRPRRSPLLGRDLLSLSKELQLYGRLCQLRRCRHQHHSRHPVFPGGYPAVCCGGLLEIHAHGFISFFLKQLQLLLFLASSTLSLLFTCTA